MKLGFADGTVTISAVSAETGRAVEELDVDYAGEPLEIGFNARYILDMLQEIDGETVRFEMASAAAPTVARDPSRRQHALRADAHAGMNAVPLAREQAPSTQPARALTVRRLELRDFRNYRQLTLRARRRPDRAARRQRRRQDQPARGGVAAEPRAAGCGRPGWPISTAPAAAAGVFDAEVDGPQGPVDIDDRRTTGDGRRRSVAARRPGPAQPERAGRARQPALADAGHGPAVRRERRRAAPLSRPAGAGDRPRPRRPGRRASSGPLRERSHLLRARTAAIRRGSSAIERRMAEAAVAVAAARRELVRELDAELARAPAALPRARAWRWPARSSAGSRRCRRWRSSSGWPRRSRPAATTTPQTGGAAVGPHRSDLVATDARHGEPAARCSTGRQKAYLISIVLAEARLRLRRHGDLPILLLDEVTAHLDPRRRIELLARTGRARRPGLADRHRGAAVRATARGGHVFHVVNGALTPHD